jgi:N-ethylmaleimide reductase
MSEEILFSPLRLGELHHPNRIVMAPLTRMRAGAGHVPTQLNAEYYTQRAAAGLIISEGTAISPQAHGYPNAPGNLFGRPDHGLAGDYRPRPRAGRPDRHADRSPRSELPLLATAEWGAAPSHPRPFRRRSLPLPKTPSQCRRRFRAPDASEIPGVIATFRQAALNAIAAGFDGVELAELRR